MRKSFGLHLMSRPEKLTEDDNELTKVNAFSGKNEKVVHVLAKIVLRRDDFGVVGVCTCI